MFAKGLKWIVFHAALAETMLSLPALREAGGKKTNRKGR
jgi:hypothetical protein